MPGFGSGLFSSLQFRLALGFFLALVMALLLIGVATGVATGRQAQRFDQDRDSAQVERLRKLVAEYYASRSGWANPDTSLQENVERAASISGRHIVVYDETGAVIANSHPGLLNAEDPMKGKGRWGPPKSADKISVRFEDDEVGAFTVSAVPAGASPSIGIPDPTADRISKGVERSLLWAGIGAAALGTFLVWLISRRTLAPLQNLGAAARQLGRGDFSQRAEDAGPTEIRELAQSFNAMATELEEAERHRRNMTADIAHELRTPLSNIQGYLEAIRDGLVQPTPDTIDTIHEQAIHLSRLVEDLRLLAQVESGELHLQLTPVSVGDLLQSGVEAVRPRAEAKSVVLSLEAAPSLRPVMIDATRISQVVGNLLENAITHTPEGGSVSVSARELDGFLEIAVADTGPGIAPEDIPRLFDRFYRADPSRSRATGGTGLGLTIARRLVEAHGGTIEVNSVVGVGSVFTIRLPLGT